MYVNTIANVYGRRRAREQKSSLLTSFFNEDRCDCLTRAKDGSSVDVVVFVVVVVVVVVDVVVVIVVVVTLKKCTPNLFTYKTCRQCLVSRFVGR